MHFLAMDEPHGWYVAKSNEMTKRALSLFDAELRAEGWEIDVCARGLGGSPAKAHVVLSAESRRHERLWTQACCQQHKVDTALEGLVRQMEAQIREHA